MTTDLTRHQITRSDAGGLMVTRDLRVLGFGAKIAVTGGPLTVCILRPEPGQQAVGPSPLEASRPPVGQGAGPVTEGGDPWQSALRHPQSVLLALSGCLDGNPA